MGATVQVTQTFMSNTKDNSKELPEGTVGHVQTIDEDGDAYIDFESGIGSHWVLKTDVYKLRRQAPS